MLKIVNLSYQYPQNKALYHYNLTVESSQIVAIMGKSGSGKSTLLDLITGFLVPQSGSIVLDGVEWMGLPIAQRPFSILFQNHNLFEHLSVQKNILLGISKGLRDKKEDIKKVQDILKEIGLEHYAHTLVSKLSGGQQQRVALARVLLRQSPLLLLDEPFTGLDATTKKEMLDLVLTLTRRYHLHTMMVTHDPQECEAIATHIYTIENNHLEQQC